MATVPFNAPPGTRSAVSSGTKAIVSFIPCGINPDTLVAFGGADSTTSVPKGVGYLCTLESMDAIPLEALTSETYRWVGKQALQYTTGGQIPEFNLMLDSGDTTTLNVMMGKNPSSSTANVFIPRVDVGASGHLLIRLWTLDGELQKSILIPNLSVKFSEVMGAGSPDERLLQQVTFYKREDAEIFITTGTKTFGVGFYKLISGGAGTGVPTTAPDGVITTFVAGKGNVAGIAGATSPIPLKLDDEYISAKYGSTATDFHKYIIGCWKTGTLQPYNTTTYTSGTQTVTFTTAPLITDSVLFIYVYNAATAFSEVWSNDPRTTVVEMEQYGWPSYT